MLFIDNRLCEGSESLSMITLSPHMGQNKNKHVQTCNLPPPPVPFSWDGPSTCGAVGFFLGPIAKEDADIGDLRRSSINLS